MSSNLDEAAHDGSEQDQKEGPPDEDPEMKDADDEEIADDSGDEVAEGATPSNEDEVADDLTTEDFDNDQEDESGVVDKNNETEKSDIDEKEDDNDEGNDISSVRTSDSRGENEGPVRRDRSPYAHIPDHLDRSTINAIKAYLTTFDARTALDEDEVVQLMTKTDRNVEYRAKYYANPLDDIIDEDKVGSCGI